MNIEAAKVGDYLIGRRYGTDELFKVERITPTLVICGHYKFRMNGHQVGGESYSKYYVRIAEPAEIERCLARRLKGNLEAKLHSAREDSWSLATLRKVEKILADELTPPTT